MFPLFRAGGQVVRVLNLLEALLGGCVARVLVRVVLAGELAVGLLDLVRRSVLRDAARLVRVLHSANTTLAGRRTRSPRGCPFRSTGPTEPGSASSAGCASSASWTCGSKAPSVSI